MSTYRERQRRVGLTLALLDRLMDEHPEVEPTQVGDALAGFAYDDGWHDGHAQAMQSVAAFFGSTARVMYEHGAWREASLWQSMSAQWSAAARELAGNPRKLHGPLVEVLTDFFDRAEAEAFA